MRMVRVVALCALAGALAAFPAGAPGQAGAPGPEGYPFVRSLMPKERGFEFDWNSAAHWSEGFATLRARRGPEFFADMERLLALAAKHESAEVRGVAEVEAPGFEETRRLWTLGNIPEPPTDGLIAEKLWQVAKLEEKRPDGSVAGLKAIFAKARDHGDWNLAYEAGRHLIAYREDDPGLQNEFAEVCKRCREDARVRAAEVYRLLSIDSNREALNRGGRDTGSLRGAAHEPNRRWHVGEIERTAFELYGQLIQWESKYRANWRDYADMRQVFDQLTALLGLRAYLINYDALTAHDPAVRERMLAYCRRILLAEDWAATAAIPVEVPEWAPLAFSPSATDYSNDHATEHAKVDPKELSEATHANATKRYASEFLIVLRMLAIEREGVLFSMDPEDPAVPDALKEAYRQALLHGRRVYVHEASGDYLAAFREPDSNESRARKTRRAELLMRACDDLAKFEQPVGFRSARADMLYRYSPQEPRKYLALAWERDLTDGVSASPEQSAALIDMLEWIARFRTTSGRERIETYSVLTALATARNLQLGKPAEAEPTVSDLMAASLSVADEANHVQVARLYQDALEQAVFDRKERGQPLVRTLELLARWHLGQVAANSNRNSGTQCDGVEGSPEWQVLRTYAAAREISADQDAADSLTFNKVLENAWAVKADERQALEFALRIEPCLLERVAGGERGMGAMAFVKALTTARLLHVDRPEQTWAVLEGYARLLSGSLPGQGYENPTTSHAARVAMDLLLTGGHSPVSFLDTYREKLRAGLTERPDSPVGGLEKAFEARMALLLSEPSPSVDAIWDALRDFADAVHGRGGWVPSQAVAAADKRLSGGSYAFYPQFHDRLFVAAADRVGHPSTQADPGYGELVRGMSLAIAERMRTWIGEESGLVGEAGGAARPPAAFEVSGSMRNSYPEMGQAFAAFEEHQRLARDIRTFKELQNVGAVLGTVNSALRDKKGIDDAAKKFDVMFKELQRLADRAVAIGASALYEEIGGAAVIANAVRAYEQLVAAGAAIYKESKQ
ncbi:MAG: hypothetical protein SF028_07030 [Candidatus Sumerlaeia bacterium]|nr:hypothetical protein [Candidatus Sumerlaeia bacterium]